MSATTSDWLPPVNYGCVNSLSYNYLVFHPGHVIGHEYAISWIFNEEKILVDIFPSFKCVRWQRTLNWQFFKHREHSLACYAVLNLKPFWIRYVVAQDSFNFDGNFVFQSRTNRIFILSIQSGDLIAILKEFCTYSEIDFVFKDRGKSGKWTRPPFDRQLASNYSRRRRSRKWKLTIPRVFPNWWH